MGLAFACEHPVILKNSSSKRTSWLDGPGRVEKGLGAMRQHSGERNGCVHLRSPAVDPVLQASGSLIPATNRKHPEVLIPTKVHGIVAIAPRNFRLRKYRIDNAVSLSLALISTRPGLLCEIVNLFGLGCRVALEHVPSRSNRGILVGRKT